MLAAYQITAGMNDLSTPATWGFTIGFGTLLVASLLLIILGFDGLENQTVVIVSTLIPLCISFGLISVHFPDFILPYLIFCIVGFSVILVSRFSAGNKIATIILALVHGIAGILIIVLPVLQSITGQTRPGYILVGLGGAIIGIGGLLLAFSKTGRPILTQEKILSVLPVLLLLMTTTFIGGFLFQ
jgi:hypothetical protein